MVYPCMGMGVLIPPVDGFLQRLRALTERHGIVLIFDEVISFRIAWGGAQERFGVRPDLTTFGKIIGGGLPVGAFGGRAEDRKSTRLNSVTSLSRMPSSA